MLLRLVVLLLQTVDQFEGLDGSGVSRRAQPRKETLLLVSRMLWRGGGELGQCGIHVGARACP